MGGSLARDVLGAATWPLRSGPCSLCAKALRPRCDAMLSFEHEFRVDLFRKDSTLAVALLREHAGIAVDHAWVEQGSIDLSQVAPTKYHADAVIVLHDDADRPMTGIIVEVQRHI